MNKKFLRRNTREYSRLGRKRKKLQKWRRPRGKDNKMRLKEKGRPGVVKIGYKQSNSTRGKINGMNVNMIKNLNDLKNLENGSPVTIGRFGKKKKLELIKIIKEKGLTLINFSNKINLSKRLPNDNPSNKLNENKK